MSGLRAREKPTNSERILAGTDSAPHTAKRLFDVATTRALESAAAAHLPPHILMQRAGLAVARLSMAIAPHSRVIWIACGPGNNGGDGFEAARLLKQWGKSPIVTMLPSKAALPPDAAASRQGAVESGVLFATTPPAQYDLCIDALFGIGKTREFDSPCTEWVRNMRTAAAPVLAVDIPSGLDADSGAGNTWHVKADFTLSLLTLKPGLFTADGRQACGEIWFNSLDVTEPADASAQLNESPRPTARPHNTHKGTFGDVGIVGGCHGMGGAAMLAAQAALHAGCGRVYVALLDSTTAAPNWAQPELMLREPSQLAYESMVVVAGCGGGSDIRAHLPGIVARSQYLVLDADALNALATEPLLQNQVASRTAWTTVMTPHPLEAARLMGWQSLDVQRDRVGVAQALAERFACTVVLKGSGTIIAAPGMLARINPTGNARLASAGTGDVLAGLIGAYLASGGNLFRATCDAVFRHGQVADMWTAPPTLTASTLAQAL